MQTINNRESGWFGTPLSRSGVASAGDGPARPPEKARKRIGKGLGWSHHHPVREERAMAKSQKKSNKETRKPKKETAKKIAAAPSTKGMVHNINN
jgi:hypothetical protein